MLTVIGFGIDDKDGAVFTLKNAECFDISYPSFLEDLKRMRFNISQ